MIRFFAATAALLLAGAAFAELPRVRDARVVQPPPGAPVAAGYLTLTNTGDEELVISGASSATVGRVELHRTTIVDDVARMERQERLTVPAGETLTLERGGYHLMLMEIGDGFVAGDEVVVVFDTNAGAFEVTMPVREGDVGMGHGDATGGGTNGGMSGGMTHEDGVQDDGAADAGTMRHDGAMRDDGEEMPGQPPTVPDVE